MNDPMTQEMFDEKAETICRIYNIPRDSFRYACQELFYWQYAPGTNFSSLLYSLFQKADPINREKLLRGFPEYSLAHSLWKACENTDQFCKFADVGFKAQHEAN